ncbi:thermonuclease family protein [Sinorhizobium meliloti]|uniref:thermonuclease family protein n=1 Tax=Rhizobium meliloti TaxID=382 RepID=UPI0020910412|nr:thermonuclease family protein [Sinorhizobium meliloti]MCO5966150.1 thermonuclease family protein [Sinorhizobium meliloti]
MRSELAILFAALLASQSFAQAAAINFPSDVTFETGDAWSYEGRKYRLFGVQSCIRGTVFRAPDGQEEDCGLHSVASLMALFSTGTIACQPVGTTKEGATFVVCAANIDGATVDVGTALISSGAAFAATLPSGTPVSTAYAVAELSARESRSGLWAGSFDHPVSLLLNQP